MAWAIRKTKCRIRYIKKPRGWDSIDEKLKIEIIKRKQQQQKHEKNWEITS